MRVAAGSVLLLGAAGLLWPQHVEELVAAPLWSRVLEHRPGAVAEWLAFDALANMSAFAIITVALGVLLRRGWWVAVVVAAAAGWLVELTQLLLPGRTTDPRDLLSDTVGALLGGLALRAIAARAPAPKGNITVVGRPEQV